MKILRGVLCLVIILFLLPGRAMAEEVSSLKELGELELSAEAVFLVDRGTGKILFAENEDMPMFPASTTKIMTALLLLEHAELNEVIVVGKEINCIGVDSSVAKLKVGDRLTVADIAYALMLPSGNDAAYTAAVFIGRKVSGFELMDINQAVEVFVGLMNKRARELGAMNTNFTGPDGYHMPEHVTTARDLVLIAQAALGNEFLCQVAATEEYFWQDKRWSNSNRLLRRDCPEEYYPWVTGLKTGYTPEAGSCLIFTASGGGRDLLGVALNAPRREIWQDSRRLLEYGFSSWKNYAMLVEGREIITVPIQGQRWDQPEMLKILAGGTYSDLHNVADIRRLELDLSWAQGLAKSGKEGLVLKAPIRDGQVLGLAVVSLDGERLAEVEMIAAYEIKAFNWWLPMSATAFGPLVLLYIIRRRKKSRPIAS